VRLSRPVGIVILVGLGAAGAAAQRLGVGVTGGMPLTAPLTAEPPAFHADRSRWTAGPSLDVGLAGGFSLRLEALYRRFGYRYEAPESAGPAGEIVRPSVRRWEFPLLIRYQPGRGRLRPFLSAGVCLNRIAGASELRDGPAELRHRQALGYVLGGGLEIGSGRVRLAPELRYTHWGDRNFGVRDTALRSNLDQLDLLASFRITLW